MNPVLLKVNIENEWNFITNSPVLYFSSIIVVGITIWIIIHYLFKTRIENLNSTIQNLEKQLSIYKDKKYIIGQTKYSEISDKELIEEAKEKLSELKAAFKTYDDATKRVDFSKSSHEEFMKNQDEAFHQLMQAYELELKVPMILLREQLLMRLPKDFQSNKEIWKYEHPTNTFGIKDILKDFEIIILSFKN